MSWVLKGRNIYTEDGRIVAQVHYPIAPGDLGGVSAEVKAEMKQNALVLVAAPELLALARLVVSQTDEDENGDMPDHPRGTLWTLRKAADGVLAKVGGK